MPTIRTANNEIYCSLSSKTDRGLEGSAQQRNWIHTSTGPFYAYRCFYAGGQKDNYLKHGTTTHFANPFRHLTLGNAFVRGWRSKSNTSFCTGPNISISVSVIQQNRRPTLLLHIPLHTLYYMRRGAFISVFTRNTLHGTRNKLLSERVLKPNGIFPDFINYIRISSMFRLSALRQHPFLELSRN